MPIKKAILALVVIAMSGAIFIVCLYFYKVKEIDNIAVEEITRKDILENETEEQTAIVKENMVVNQEIKNKIEEENKNERLKLLESLNNQTPNNNFLQYL